MEPQHTSPARDWRWLLFVVALLVLAFDQWSKAFIIDWLPLGASWRPWAGTPGLELFALTHTKNTGAAFGIFESGGFFFTAVATIVSLAIVAYAPRLPRGQWWLPLALGLELGGALGNLVDRVRIGHVTDFIHVGSFAIFNVADSAVFIGVLILFTHFWREDERRKRAEVHSAECKAQSERQRGRGGERERGRGARVYTLPGVANAAREEHPYAPSSNLQPPISNTQYPLSNLHSEVEG